MLAQVRQLGDRPPDLDEPARCAAFFSALLELADAGLLAYHDRSDGGLFVTLLEMAFAGRAGLDIDLGARHGADRGAVQRRTRCGAAGARARIGRGRSQFRRATARLTARVPIGRANAGDAIRIADARTVSTTIACGIAARLGGDQLAHAGAARQSGVCAEEYDALSTWVIRG